eukprot:TRINITY_DN1226_c0_g1_i1.p1 TRINITY_DN1226_c0_g1~~TRINITY_DN1226_c0_g1_i1.p1  ORF type:complete len:281 (+),score=63.82 TRINITY_DN1226_c0_g1_i1:38-880(+)
MGSKLSHVAPACCRPNGSSKLHESSPDSLLMNTTLHAKQWFHATQIPDMDCKLQEQRTADQNIWDLVHGLDRSLRDLCEAASEAYHFQNPQMERIPFLVTDCFNHLEFLLAEFSNPSSTSHSDGRFNVRKSIIQQLQKVHQSAKLIIEYRDSMRENADDAVAYWRSVQRDLNHFREKYQISKTSADGMKLWKLVRENVSKASETQKIVELAIEKASRVLSTLMRVLSLESLKDVAPDEFAERKQAQLERRGSGNKRRNSRKAVIRSPQQSQSFNSSLSSS